MCYFYDNYEIKPLNIILTKTITYVKSYAGQTRYMYFLIEDEDLLEKYDSI